MYLTFENEGEKYIGLNKGNKQRDRERKFYHQTKVWNKCEIWINRRKNLYASHLLFQGIRLIADLCLDHKIFDPQLWNSLLIKLLSFDMVCKFLYLHPKHIQSFEILKLKLKYKNSFDGVNRNVSRTPANIRDGVLCNNS